MFGINSQLIMLINKQVNDGIISINKLCYGLCARTVIRTLENEASVVDMKVIKLLLERLGKSPNKLEIIAPYEVIEMEVRQLDFDAAIDNRDKMTAEILLDYYKSAADAPDSNNVEKMYYYRNRVSFEYYMMGNTHGALEYARQACNQTVPGFENNNLEKYCVSVTELINILMYYYLILITSQEDYEIVKSRLLEIEEYAEKYITDEEELARIIPKQKWVCALISIKEKDYTRAVQQCMEGIAFLRKYALLQFMLPLLNIIVEYGNRTDFENEYADYVDLKKAVEDYYRLCGADTQREELLLAESNRVIYHYDLEVLFSQRKIKGLSQEELAEAVGVLPEMISKYETGSRRPNKNIYIKIMEALGLEWCRYNAVLVSESFESTEIMRELILASIRDNERLMEEYIAILMERLDMGYIRNRRNLRVFQNELDLKSGKTDAHGFIELNKDLLKSTYPIFEGVDLRTPFSDEERLISQIGIMLGRIGKREELLDLTRKVLKTINKSSVDVRLMARLCGHLYANYCLELCRMNVAYEEEVIDVAKKIYSMRSLSSVESLFSVLAIIYYKKDKEQSCSLMKDSLIIAKMIYSEDNYKMAERNLKRYY